MDIVAYLPNPETDLVSGGGDPFWTPFITFLGLFIIFAVFVCIHIKNSKKIPTAPQ